MDAPIAADPAALIRTTRHLAMLQELAEIGMQLARRTLDQANHPDAPGDPNLAYARIARAIRCTIALEARIAAPPAPPPPSLTAGQRQHRRRRTAELRTLVERSIEKAADTDPQTDTEALLADLSERLDEPDLQSALDREPIGLLAYDLCDALGIQPDCSQWTDDQLHQAMRHLGGDPDDTAEDEDDPAGQGAHTLDPALADTG